MKTELAAGGGVPAARLTSAARVESAARVASDGRGTSAARVTSLADRPLLAKPGLAKPAPVSSRVSAAAASVAVVSDGDSSSDAPETLPTGGLVAADAAAGAEPGLGLAGLSATAAVSGFCGLTDLNGLSGLTGPSGSGRRCGLVTLDGVNTLRGVDGVLGVPLPSDPPSASGVASPFGTVASIRFSGLVNAAGAGSSAPVGNPPWILPWAPFVAESDDEADDDSCSVPFLRLEELLPGSALALLDLRTDVSTLGSAPPASSASAAGSAWLSTHPPVKSLATRLSATSDAGAGITRSRQA